MCVFFFCQLSLTMYMPTQAMQAIFMWMEIQKEIVLQEKLLAAGLYILETLSGEDPHWSQLENSGRWQSIISLKSPRSLHFIIKPWTPVRKLNHQILRTYVSYSDSVILLHSVLSTAQGKHSVQFQRKVWSILTCNDCNILI